MKKFSILVLTAAMVFGAAQTIFATTSFLDVPSDHWAKEDIAFAAEKGIVNGYHQAWTDTYTFAPESAVSYEEAATMLYRALASAGEIAGDAGQAALIEQYKDVLDQNNIADWAREYVAYLLDRGIIAGDELASFVVGEATGVPAPRMTVAVWTAKALGKDSAPVHYLPYADKSLINDEQAGYVDTLYRYGIMKGSLNLDGSVTFNGNDGVKRSEFAAIANRVYRVQTMGNNISADIFSYAGEQIANVRYDRAADVIVGGEKSGLTAEKAAADAAVVAGMAMPGDMTAQIHFSADPVAGTGKIKAIDKLSDEITRVAITVGNAEIYYIIDSNTVYVGNQSVVKVGASISYIADGVKLIEIQ